MIEKYFEILSIGKNATLSEIKKAYKRKAKLLHPDVNKSDNAHEEFILLNEAFEYLQHLKTGKLYSQKTNTYTRSKHGFNDFEEWERVERQRARERAQEHAQMQYEAFTQTEYYKNMMALSLIVDLISVLLVIFIFIGAPLLGFLSYGIGGLIAGIFVIFVTVHYWTDIIIYNRPQIILKELVPSIIRISKTKMFQVVMVTMLNVFLLFHIGFNTLVTIWSLCILFGVFISIGYLIGKKIKTRFYKRMIILGIAPGLINLFLLFNFIFSSNSVVETYSFKHEIQPTNSGWQKTTLIKLQDNMYPNFIGIRLFMDFEKMKSARRITYRFEDGLFGIRVMKDYEFDSAVKSQKAANNSSPN